MSKLPLQYLFEPWKAPLKVQEEADCIVGQDYPQPMVDHKEASLECMAKMHEVKCVWKGYLHVFKNEFITIVLYHF